MISYLIAGSSSWKSVMPEKFTLHNGAHRFSFLVLSWKSSFTVVYSDRRGESFLDLLNDCTAFEISTFWKVVPSFSLVLNWIIGWLVPWQCYCIKLDFEFKSMLSFSITVNSPIFKMLGHPIREDFHIRPWLLLGPIHNKMHKPRLKSISIRFLERNINHRRCFVCRCVATFHKLFVIYLLVRLMIVPHNDLYQW